jgi:hypothetical protein
MAAVTTKKKKSSRKAIPGGKGLTFEKVWTTIHENAEKQEKRQKETDLKIQKTDQVIEETKQILKEIAELQKRRDTDMFFEETRQILKEAAESHKEAVELHKKRETDSFFEEIRQTLKEAVELHKENERISKRNSKQMGELHRRFGQLAEHLVAPGIAKRFNELGYHFSAISPKGQKINDESGKIKTGIDLLLENGKTIMAVEVKTRPVIQDVEHHLKRLEILRDHRRGVNDLRKIQGAIAGAIYENDVKEAVREAGMYVIEQSGDTMKIDMPDGFIPREW